MERMFLYIRMTFFSMHCPNFPKRITTMCAGKREGSPNALEDYVDVTNYHLDDLEDKELIIS